MDRDGDRCRFIPLSLKKKMADVVLLVSELEDYFDFINVVVEDDDRLHACWGRIKWGFVEENELFQE